MPGPNFVLDKGFVVDAAANQFDCVKAAALEHVTPSTAAGDACLGVLQQTVAAAEAGIQVADVRMMGISRCRASAAVTIGAPVRATSAGKVAPLAAATANQNQLGIALTAATTDGDHLDVLLTIGVQRTIP
jgi:hypothetical protein